MTRSDLVEELAARFTQLTHRDAEFAVKTVLDAMSTAMVKGHRIEIRGFGSFSINRRPPGLAEIHAPAKACKSLKNAFRTSNPAKPCAKPSTKAASISLAPSRPERLGRCCAPWRPVE